MWSDNEIIVQWILALRRFPDRWWDAWRSGGQYFNEEGDLLADQEKLSVTALPGITPHHSTSPLFPVLHFLMIYCSIEGQTGVSINSNGCQLLERGELMPAPARSGLMPAPARSELMPAPALSGLMLAPALSKLIPVLARSVLMPASARLEGR